MAEYKLGVTIPVLGAGLLGFGLVYLLTRRGAAQTVCTPGQRRGELNDCWDGIPYGGEVCDDLGMGWIPVETTCPPPQRLSSQLILYSESSLFYLGTANTIYGELTIMSGTPIANKNVKITINGPSGANIQTKATGVDGKAIFQYTPSVQGTHDIIAEFVGDAQYLGSSDSASFEAVPVDIPAMFTVIGDGSTYTAKRADGTTLTSGSNAASIVNAAINSLTPARTTKQKVQLRGPFNLVSTINLANYTILEVASGGKVAAMPSLPGHLATAPSGSHNFEIVGGEWDGLRGSRSLGGDRQPFFFSRPSNLLMSNLHVHDGTYDNICIEYGNNIALESVESGFSNWDSIMMAYSSNSRVENCHIHDSLKSGCYFYCEDDGVAQHADNNVMRGNLVERIITTGLSISLRGLEDIGNGNLIENNTCIDCGGDGYHYGLNVGWADATGMRRSNNNIIRNNIVRETGYYPGGTGGGLTIQGDNNECYENIIELLTDFGIGISGNNNEVHHNTVSGTKTPFYAGIMVTDGNSNQVHDNTIFNCPIGLKVEPQYLNGVGNLNHFYNNKISNISNYWFAFGSGGCSGAGCCSGNIFENNIVTGNHNYSTAGSKNTVVQNNTYN